jgi:hypothetical protein
MQRKTILVKGVNIEMAPLDEDQVRARITWSEQDVGGGKVVVEVNVAFCGGSPRAEPPLSFALMKCAPLGARG